MKSGVTICGVYVLVDKDEIVYIGSSVDIRKRVYAHRRERAFNRALSMSLPRNIMHVYEAALIRCLRPAGNMLVPGIGDLFDAEILYGLGLRDTLTEDDIVRWEDVA